MRRGHISARVAMEIGGWKTTSVFHRYAIVDNQDVARAMDMLERSQDQQRQELERTLAAKRGQPIVINDRNATGDGQTKKRANLAGNSSLTSRLRHVEGLIGVSKQIRRGTKHDDKALTARGASGGFSARLTTEPDTRFHEALGKGRGGPASAKPILVNSTPEE